MPNYNKLVRDRIPEIIKHTGKGFRSKQLDEAEYIRELRRKLHEEMNEYEEATTDGQAIEELADVLEIIRCLAIVHGSSVAELETLREKKAEERGSFDNKTFLIDVDDE